MVDLAQVLIKMEAAVCAADGVGDAISDGDRATAELGSVEQQGRTTLDAGFVVKRRIPRGDESSARPWQVIHRDVDGRFGQM